MSWDTYNMDFYFFLLYLFYHNYFWQIQTSILKENVCFLELFFIISLNWSQLGDNIMYFQINKLNKLTPPPQHTHTHTYTHTHKYDCNANSEVIKSVCRSCWIDIYFILYWKRFHLQTFHLYFFFLFFFFGDT